jgi:ribonuclease HII
MMRSATAIDKTLLGQAPRVPDPGAIATRGPAPPHRDPSDRATPDPVPAKPVPAKAVPAKPTKGRAPRPSLAWEKKLWASGHGLIAGVDEVGRGAWAGPLSVGVVVLGASPPRAPAGLRDSKQLLEAAREHLFEPLARWCTSWAVGHAAPEECDQLGMTAALRLATRRAFAQVPPDRLPDAVVLDGSFDYVTPQAAPSLFDEGPIAPDWLPVVQTVVKGDSRCVSVAAASVLAKVTRDRLMRADAESYPPFEFDRNKGYPSPTHKRALCGYGLTAIHRRSWVYVDNLPWR